MDISEDTTETSASATRPLRHSGTDRASAQPTKPPDRPQDYPPHVSRDAYHSADQPPPHATDGRLRGELALRTIRDHIQPPQNWAPDHHSERAQQHGAGPFVQTDWPAIPMQASIVFHPTYVVGHHGYPMSGHPVERQPMIFGHPWEQQQQQQQHFLRGVQEYHYMQQFPRYYPQASLVHHAGFVQQPQQHQQHHQTYYMSRPPHTRDAMPPQYYYAPDPSQSPQFIPPSRQIPHQPLSSHITGDVTRETNETRHMNANLAPHAAPSYPRGPPRKPKQSGFAIWVGNLPPDASIGDLKDFFSQGAPDEIKSLFHITRSNCAFVNYRSAESCRAASHRFHESRFQGNRIVCRLRHSFTERTGAARVETSSDADADRDVVSRVISDSDHHSDAEKDAEADVVQAELPDGVGVAAADAVRKGLVDPKAVLHASSTPTSDTAEEETRASSSSASSSVHGKSETRRPATPHQATQPVLEDGRKIRVLERFFIVKSHTLQDLEASVRDGVWATQAHNEAALAVAYEQADAVYLIFSANKSGEYFGYARMRSTIDPEIVSYDQRRPIEQTAPGGDWPTLIPTPATRYARKGRIVDDPARGTIFWEADTSSSGEEESNPKSPIEQGAPATKSHDRSKAPQQCREAAPEKEAALQQEMGKQDWGRPFKLEWLCVTPLPFHKARGLRNPWNQNREIKIARDGTELEPRAGKMLLDLFGATARKRYAFIPSIETGQHGPYGSTFAPGHGQRQDATVARAGIPAGSEDKAVEERETSSRVGPRDGPLIVDGS